MQAAPPTSPVSANPAVTPDAEGQARHESLRTRMLGGAIAVLAVTLCLFQLYTAGVNPLGLFFQRTIHLAFVLMIAFLTFPAHGSGRARGPLVIAVDALFFLGAIVTGFYLPLYLDAIVTRVGFWTQTDIWVSIIAVITLFEASRRVVGPGITVIGLVFMLYALAGPRGMLPWLGEWMPGILAHRGYGFERLVTHLYLTQEGIFGLPLGVAATYVFIFILFGAVLERTGAGRFFIELAYALTGRRRGGPAKAAVVASMTMGSITGSAIANVVTTGPFTIPLMKRLGYRPAQAAGVEAAASTGGQIMPPLMGAGAFLIAEYTGLPYAQIVAVSIFPAALYFLTIYLFVHIVAVKQGLRGMSRSELPVVRDLMRDGWYFFVPFTVLVWLLVMGLSPMRVGFFAVLSVLAVALLKVSYDWLRAGEGRIPLLSGLVHLGRVGVDICVIGTRNALTVSLACAVGGIIVGVIGLTGLGLKFTSLMLTFTGGNILLALLLVLLASLVLGFGLPVTASYIVMVILVGPALSTEFAIPLIIVHLVVFWYSQDSNVTPPVALAAIAASAVARAGLMESSVQAWKFAKGLYIIPLFMVFNEEIIIGGPLPLVLWNAALAIVATVAFVAVIEAFLFARITPVLRTILGVAAIGCLSPWFVFEAAGMTVCLLILAWNLLLARREEPDPAMVEGAA